MTEFNVNQMVTFDERGRLIDAETRELMPEPAPRRVCENTLIIRHRLGWIHNGKRYCMDRGCNYSEEIPDPPLPRHRPVSLYFERGRRH